MTTQKRRYYVLVEQSGTGPWYVSFGDYDKECVADEMQDRLDHDVPQDEVAIICTYDDQPSIDAALAKLNDKTPGEVRDRWPHSDDVVSPGYFAQRPARAEPTLQPVDAAPAAPAMSDAEIVARAMNILETRMMTTPLARGAQQFTSPMIVRQYLALQLATLEHERFDVLFLDTQHRLIAHEGMFRGTISSASVYPREVVKAALRHNASAVILAHNHPSGETEPSDADLRITTRLQEALALVDVKVLDHVIIGGISSYSFAETGKL